MPDTWDCSSHAELRSEPSMFDYMIVGVGSAGCVQAARVSEDPSSFIGGFARR